MAQSLSLVIPCYNDAQAFSDTIRSIENEMEPNDEVIVIDSSDDRNHVHSVLATHSSLSCKVKCVWTPPKGVYDAFNVGLGLASKDWIQILNSGDHYVPAARRMISEAIGQNLDCLIHVFGQIATGKSDLTYLFLPDNQGVWPTQSVIINKSVHDAAGPFNVNYRIVSDQLYYADLRAKFSWMLHNSPLTTYDLHGLSATVSIRNSKELYVMWRALGLGPFRSVFRAYITPGARAVLNRVAGPTSVIILKRNFSWAFSNYHRSAGPS
jgi:glycosyltransferase involved in cell wall biosynthesis